MKNTLTACISLAICATLPEPANAQPVGGCKFAPATLQFFGTPLVQLGCLLKKVQPRGSGSVAQPVPAWLAANAGQTIPLTVEQVARYFSTNGIATAELGGPLVKGNASRRRYFVIHDTSAPEFSGTADFPANINDSGWSGNRLQGWASIATRVNLLISRDGRSRALVDWAGTRTLPAIKIEQNSRIPQSRAVFVHVENIQPRIKPAGSWGWKAPQPGFSDAQQKRLAVAYVVASLRAGRWLIPAFHFNIDQGLPDAHDDPQNFDLAAWGIQIEAVVRSISTG